ncbi:MAG: DsbA family protein [Acidobacteriota bacterium]
MIRTAVVVLAGAVALAACTPKQDPDTTRRLAAIEAQLADQQKLLAELKGAQGNSPELGAILDDLENLTARIVKLEAAPRAAARAMRREPDRAAVYAVPIAGSPTYGSPKAKVTMVMAMDFACPYCRRAFDTVDDLRKMYGNDLRVVYKAMVVHPATATHAAIAACAANHQGKWRELAQLLWTKSFDAHDFADATIDKLAAEAKLDMTRYGKDVAGGCPQEVRDEQAALVKLGVGATPSFFINGRFMAGAMPQRDFETLIDEELAKAKTAIGKGVKPEKYYDQEIVAKGLTALAPATP